MFNLGSPSAFASWISISQNLRVFGPGLNPFAPYGMENMPQEDEYFGGGGVSLRRNLSGRRFYRSAVDMDDRGWTSLHVVAKKGDLRKVKQLLDEGVDVNVCAWGPKSQGVTPLHLAAQGGHVKVMDELLERGANIDARTKGACGWTPLHKAAREKKREAIKYLVENGAFLADDINDNRFNPPLHYCPGLEWAYEEMKRVQDENSNSSVGDTTSYSSST